MSELSFNPVGGWATAIVVGAVLVALLFFGPERGRTTFRQRAILAGVRLLIIFLIFFAMLRPARVVTEIKKQSATLVLLVDRSRSMQVGDQLGGKSRWEALRAIVGDAAPLLHELDEEFEIKIYEFDANVEPVEFGPDTVQLGDPRGEQSAIGAALEEVLRREIGKRLVGVMLLSDGAQRAYAPHDTPPQTAAARLMDLGYPLYTFAFGQARGLGQARDVAVRDMLANPTVFVKNQLDVSGSLRVDGYANAEIPVELLFETAPGKMEVVGVKRMTVGSEGGQAPIDLSHVPQMPGEYKLTLRAKPQDGELVTTNNELSSFVRVLKGGIHVLYLEGALRAESTFLRRSLGASPDINIDYEMLADRGKWPAPLDDRFDEGKYDVMVIGDLDSDALRTEDWQRLADLVDRGAGLIMLGGFQSFGPGGYGNTPLADVLPIRIGRLERQNLDEPVRTDLHLPGPLRMVPAAPLGTRHAVMHLAAGEENRRLWEQLPPLGGANRFEGLKPEALVLGETLDGNWPLLVAGQWGGGRVLAFAGDGTWQWVLGDEKRGYGLEHRRFWRQVILWLAKKDETSEGNVWIKLAQRRFRPASRVPFEVGAETPEGEPVPDARFEAHVILPDGSRENVRLMRQGETLSGTFLDTQSPGDYAIEVTATSDAGALGTARARFLVYEQDLELDNPAADPGLLSSLARTTAEVGGAAHAAEELPAVLRRIQQEPPDLEVATEIRHTYWDTWPFFLLFIAALTAEWYLRKRWGLV